MFLLTVEVWTRIIFLTQVSYWKPQEASVALNSKHVTNLNLAIDFLMSLQQKPQQPSVAMMLPTHIHTCPIITPTQQGLRTVSLMLSWDSCCHVNTAIVWARSASKWQIHLFSKVAHRNRCQRDVSQQLRSTHIQQMLNSPWPSLLSQ